MSKEKSSKKRNEAIAVLNSYKERPFIKHQWEELVQYLSQMNDPKFQDFAKREMNTIHENDALFKQIKHKSHFAHSS